MKRFIDQELLQWKHRKRRKPLIVRGARQVGKTYSIRSFGESHFDMFALADLERNPELHRIFNGKLDAKQIIADLEILLRQKIQPEKTLLFIDEIQACPRAITALRYLYEEVPDLHVIAAGSLLEFAMKDISFPVGRIQFVQLYPLCFVEYLLAIGHNEAAGILREPPKAVSEPVHEFLLEELRRYFFIGGMPESVLSYVESGSMQEAFEVQAEICETYRMDFAKYRPQVNKDCLNSVLTSISQNVGQQIKYSRLATGFSNPTLKKAFDLLAMAKIIVKIPSTDPSGLPLGASSSDKVFKGLMVDIGLMRYLTGMPIDVEYQKAELLNIYKGGMAEQFVGQEMLLSQNGSLHYWSRQAKSSSAEVDYLAIIDGKIYPIEVKSGPSGRLKSLHLFLKTYQNCPKGIVFSTGPYRELAEERISFVPLYYAFSATGGR
ncbi:MAG: AAA family ATPase [Desulfobulbaceae bacterium]|nr:AAA family ATPase [Desulfobulbaceae bacterium]